MFLLAKTRKKDGKVHRYFSVVENRRVGAERRMVQRTALHVGEINGGQKASWRQTLEFFDEGFELLDEHRSRQASIVSTVRTCDPAAYRESRASMDDLWNAAKVYRVANVMRPGPESLI
jgi:hypothetical protein